MFNLHSACVRVCVRVCFSSGVCHKLFSFANLHSYLKGTSLENEEEKAEETQSFLEPNEAADPDSTRAPVRRRRRQPPRRVPVLTRMKKRNLSNKISGSAVKPVRIQDPEDSTKKLWSCPLGCEDVRTYSKEAVEANIGWKHTGKYFGPCPRCKFISFNRVSFANHYRWRGGCDRIRKQRTKAD